MTDEELRLSKERLMKLWDAYEMQEKELKTMTGKVKDLEEKLREKDRVVETLRELVEAKDIELRKLEVKGTTLDKETADHKGRLDELTENLNLERGRYKRLFLITQELEKEVDRLSKELEDRDRWFRDNMAFLEEFPARVGKRLEMVHRVFKRPPLDGLMEPGRPVDTPPAQAPAQEKEMGFERVDPKAEALKELTSIPGVDESKANLLIKAGYDSKTKLKGASPFELVKIEGITPTLARRISDAVRS